LILEVSAEEEKKPCSFSPTTSSSPAQKEKRSPSGLANGISGKLQSMGNIVGIRAETKKPVVTYDKKRFRLPSVNTSDLVGDTVQNLAQAASILSKNVIAQPSKMLTSEEAQFDTDSGSEEDENFSDQSSDDSDGEPDQNYYIGYTEKMNLLAVAEKKGVAVSNTSHVSSPEKSQADDGSVLGPDSVAKKPIFDEGSASGEESWSDSDEDSDYEDGSQTDKFGAGGIAQLFALGNHKPGSDSGIVKDASGLSNHIVLIAAESNVLMFVQELRRPCILGDSYHPVLIVLPARPAIWNYIQCTYNDIYLMIGNPSSPSFLKRMNFTTSYSVALMGNRESMNKVDGQTVNTGTLFTYLKAESFVPPTCFLTVELTSSNNMSVLNATIMRRHREQLQKLLPSSNAARRGDTLVKMTSSQSPSEAAQDAAKQNRVPAALQMGVMGANGQGAVQTALNAVNQSLTAASKPGSMLQAGRESKDGRANRRHAALFDDMHGKFASKRGGVSLPPGAPLTNGAAPPMLAGATAGNGPNSKDASAMSSQMSTLRRRGSVMNAINTVKDAVKGFVEDAGERLLTSDEALEELWDAMDSYHILPVFASAKAFVPSSFESLLVQSYYVKLTPVICEKFVCGQLSQTMTCIELPKDLIGSKFIDIFRLFISNQVIVLGLYRAPRPSLGSTLSYVYTSPPRNAVLCAGDRVYVYGTNGDLARAKQSAAMVNNWKQES